MNLRSGLCAMALAACASAGVPDCASAAESGNGNPAIDALFAAWDRPGSPGCALAVTRNGKPVYAGGYGYANLDHDIPITTRTVFDVGSLTKQFVAASISKLELDGTLSLDDSIRRWLPELPALNQPITLRHMIYHTSGLRDYLTLFPLAGRGHHYPISHAQILDMMSRQRALVFPPAERYAYSNTAYMLLAQVVERASGKPLGEFVEERIFEPLAMQGSRMYDNHEEIIPRRATGYDRHDDDDIRMVHNSSFDVPGDGQMYTTVEDLLLWDDYLHGADTPLIQPVMLTEGTLNSGDPIGLARGLFLDEYRGLRTVQHTGSSWGFRAVLMRFTEPGLAIAIACNDGLASPLEQAHRVADHYLGDALSPQHDAGAGDAPLETSAASPGPVVTSKRLSEFVGTYFSPELDAIYRFAVAGDALVLRIEQEDPRRLLPAADDVFTFRFDEQAYSGVLSAELSFNRDADRRITGFSLSSGSERGLEFRRVEHPAFGSP